MASTAAAKPSSPTIFARSSRSPGLVARAASQATRRLAAIPASAGSTESVDATRVSTLTEDGELPGAALPHLDLGQAFVPATGIADEALLAVLAAPLADGECATDGFARKERELHAVLATLMPADSLRLERRLASPMPGDVLAAQFQRLIVGRRVRLLAFLATSRQRAPFRR